MKKISLLLLILAIFISGRSQEETEKTSFLSFYTMPFSIFDFTPRYRAGIEWHTANNIGLDVDAGYGNETLNSFPDYPVLYANYSAYEIRPEIKFYWPASKMNNRYYWGFEIFYLESTSTKTNNYFRPDPDIIEKVTRFQEATLKKTSYGAHIKAGFKRYGRKTGCIDFYVGAGIANKSTAYEDLVDPVEYYARDVYYVTTRDKYAGSFPAFSFTCGVNIGLFRGW